MVCERVVLSCVVYLRFSMRRIVGFILCLLVFYEIVVDLYLYSFRGSNNRLNEVIAIRVNVNRVFDL